MLKKIKAMEPSEPSAGVVQLTWLDLHWAGLASCEKEAFRPVHKPQRPEVFARVGSKATWIE